MIKSIHNSSNKNSFYYYSALSNGDGSKESPFGWLENSFNSGRKVTCEINTVGEHKWYYLNLKKGISYEFFTIMDWSSSMPVPLKINIYRFDDLNNCILEIPYQSSENYEEEGYSVKTKFTTEHSCIYFLEVFVEDSPYYSIGSSILGLNYTPEIVSQESGWKRNLFKINGSGWNKYGKLNNYKSLVEAGLSHDGQYLKPMYKYVKCSFDITPMVNMYQYERCSFDITPE